MPPASGTTAATEAAITGLNAKLGRKLAINDFHVSWTGQFPGQVIAREQNRGTLPMVTWYGTWSGVVARGQYDSQISAAAIKLRNPRRPLLLRYFPDMEVQAQLSVSPARYVAAWRHIWQIFRENGADNVSWVWCPSAGGVASGKAQAYYPGAGYVDWICGDGYNWAPAREGASWQGFGSIFGGFYAWGLTTHKPLMIGGFGVLERRPGDKASWLLKADRLLPEKFPAIRAVVYDDSAADDFDWRVTSSASALAAFGALARDQYFAAKPRL